MAAPSCHIAVLKAYSFKVWYIDRSTRQLEALEPIVMEADGQAELSRIATALGKMAVLVFAEKAMVTIEGEGFGHVVEVNPGTTAS